MIYFDNAATSWPKPEETIRAINNYNDAVGGNPGRSGHRLSIEAGRVVFNTRELAAELLGTGDVFQVCFTGNATEALNTQVFGLLKPGDHVIASSMEHNSVMRPLRSREGQGLEVSIVQCSPTGELDPADIVPLIKKNTRAIFLTHASNVTGTIMPLVEVGKIAREHNACFCVDAAQSAGILPINVEEMNIDLLAFTGHKSLWGPQGTGGLYIRKGLEKEIRAMALGGTGSKSEFEEQPDFMPDKFESGTPNAIGLAGLGAGIRLVLDIGVDAIRKKEAALTGLFLEGIKDISGVTVHGCADAAKQTSVVSFSIEGAAPSEAALELDEKYNIMSRPGLHCAPSAHKTTGTFPRGTNRFSFGYFNTEEEIKTAIKAIQTITPL
ncbi:MAG: aminotransferase class V-fold PLP-dependent enzyme [bacterium]|nr:aminotransferase class V-fold PLP-dependent enzyme [bacterium]